MERPFDHTGAVFELTEPQLANHYFFPVEYSTALHSGTAYQDVCIGEWAHFLRQTLLDAYTRFDLAAMTVLRRAVCYTGMKKDFDDLTGRDPITLGDCIRPNEVNFIRAAHT